jgi:DNA-binding NtrC family response regulator
MSGSIAHDPPDPGAAELKGVSILLVEDSWHLGKAMKRLLLTLGAEVVGPAATTVDAERMAAERNPDIAIVDINLRHGERSNNLIDQLLEQHVSVIIVTGYAAVSLPTQKVEAILEKPLSKERLLEELRRIIARRMDG